MLNQKKTIELKPIKLNVKPATEVQVHLRLHPNTASILFMLSRRYGYMNQGEFLDDLFPVIFEQEYGFPFSKVAVKEEEIK